MNPTTDMLRIYKKIYQLNAENIPKLINRVQTYQTFMSALQIEIQFFFITNECLFYFESDYFESILTFI